MSAFEMLCGVLALLSVAFLGFAFGISVERQTSIPAAVRCVSYAKQRACTLLADEPLRLKDGRTLTCALSDDKQAVTCSLSNPEPDR